MQPKNKYSSKYGKNNPLFVRKLIKIVIEDIEYEIFLTQSYLGDLKDNIKRLKQILKYKEAYEKAKKEKGRKKILEEYENRLKKTITHKDLNREVSYQYLIRLECYKLIKHLLGDKKYEGFKMWW